MAIEKNIPRCTIKKGSKPSTSNDKLRDHFTEHFAARVPHTEMPQGR